MTENKSISALFEGIGQFIAQSHHLIEQGHFVELAGLDNHVKSLCEQVDSMSLDDRKRYADELESLHAGLSALGVILTKQRDAVAAEIKGVSSHRKASVAYKVADATDGFGKKDG